MSVRSENSNKNLKKKRYRPDRSDTTTELSGCGKQESEIEKPYVSVFKYNSETPEEKLKELNDNI